MFIHPYKNFLVTSLILLLLGTLCFMTGMFFGKPVWETLYWQKFGILEQGEVIELRYSDTQVNGRPQQEMIVLFKGTQRILRSVPPDIINDIDSNTVSIRYNPKDSSVFALDYVPTSEDITFSLFYLLLGAGLLFTGVYFFRKHQANQERYNHIQQYGQTIEGKILDIRSGNIKVNHVQYLRVELSFLGQQQTIKNIHPDQVKGLSIKGPIQLKYNSQNPADFVLARSEREKKQNF